MVDSRQGSPNQMEQEWPGQQTGWTYKQSFKLDNLVEKEGGLLSDREEPGAADALWRNG